jgi:outer membrane protein TolC
MQEIRRSKALAEQARATWLPTLTANGYYTRLDSDRVLEGRIMTYRDTLNGNITLTVPIIQAHAWATSARANETADLAKLSAIDAKKQIAITTGRAFLTVIAQRRVLESSVHARDTALAHELYAKSRLAGGIGNRLDAVRAGQERASSDARVQTQTLALERTQEALGVLLGGTGPVDIIETQLPEPPPLPTALREAERNRSDIIAQRQRVEIARKAVRDNYTDYLPLLSAIGQPFLQTPETPTNPTSGWQAQLVLTVPLYDGGLRYGAAHEREALHEEAKIQLDALLRQVRSDVRISFEGVRRADSALEQAREASKLADDALMLAQEAYVGGTTSNLDVIDAERRSLDAATDAAVAEDAARQARLDLLFASGRFP